MLIKLVLLGVLQVTSYRPVASQTDNSPTWTSIGDRTTMFGCAVSQDLLKSRKVRYGDVLYIEGYGYRVVNDTMNKRIHNAVDLLVITRAQEKRIGVRHVNVYLVPKIKS